MATLPGLIHSRLEYFYKAIRLAKNLQKVQDIFVQRIAPGNDMLVSEIERLVSQTATYPFNVVIKWAPISRRSRKGTEITTNFLKAIHFCFDRNLHPMHCLGNQGGGDVNVRIPSLRDLPLPRQMYQVKSKTPDKSGGPGSRRTPKKAPSPAQRKMEIKFGKQSSQARATD